MCELGVPPDLGFATSASMIAMFVTRIPWLRPDIRQANPTPQAGGGCFSTEPLAPALDGLLRNSRALRAQTVLADIPHQALLPKRGQWLPNTRYRPGAKCQLRALCAQTVPADNSQLVLALAARLQKYLGRALGMRH